MLLCWFEDFSHLARFSDVLKNALSNRFLWSEGSKVTFHSILNISKKCRWRIKLNMKNNRNHVLRRMRLWTYVWWVVVWIFRNLSRWLMNKLLPPPPLQILISLINRVRWNHNYRIDSHSLFLQVAAQSNRVAISTWKFKHLIRGVNSA